jgi:N-acyl-D-amino-acid deacylase
MNFDTIIRNGQVIDGTGAARFRADVGITGDKVTAIGDLQAAEARQSINAAGLIVSPGFIDVHNHSDGWFLRRPHLTAKTQQGFTTEVLMADGISYAPVNANTAAQWMYYMRSLNGLRMDEYTGWRTLAEYGLRLDGASVHNSLIHVPYANVRSLFCGFSRKQVDDIEIKLIQNEIREGMEAGAVGLSTGLDYIAQCFSTTQELIDASVAMAPYGGLYVSHIRYKRGLLPALEEAAEIGRKAGVPVHISHLKAQTEIPADVVLGWVDKTRQSGVDLTFDVYPYQPGSTMLNFLLPYEVWEHGPLAVLDQLNRPEIKARIRAALFGYRLPLDRIHIAWLPGSENAVHIGKSLERYIDEQNVPAEEAIINLLIEERLAVLLVFNEGDDALIGPILQHEAFMLGSDGIYFDHGAVHPRVYGSAARIAGRCVREWKLFSLEAAVKKMTSFPAERFGIARRGVLQAGYFADIVVFDADTIEDKATYHEPHQPSVGVEHLLVNGTPVIAKGKPVELPGEPYPGRFLRFKRA